MSTPDERHYITIKEAAVLLGVSRKVVDRLIHDGELTRHRKPILKRGAAMLDRSEVERLVAKYRQD